MLALMLPWIYNLAKHIPIPAWTPYFKAHVELADIASVAVKNSRADATDRNIFSSILSQGEKSHDEGTLTDQQILIEAGNLISAGSDTTAETLTYLIWAVLSHPEVQNLLEEEVAHVEEPILDGELEKLPILNAVIQETLRLYPASPFPEPRVVPKGGATFQGYFLPEGTVVSTSPWVTQRNAEFFPDPERQVHNENFQSSMLGCSLTPVVYVDSTTPAGYPTAQQPTQKPPKQPGGLSALGRGFALAGKLSYSLSRLTSAVF